MPKALRHLTWILSLAALGCQQQAFRVGQRTTVQFGTVRNVEQVNLQSDVPAGALIGGTIGLMTSGGGRHAPRNAILGAAVGAGATAAVQEIAPESLIPWRCSMVPLSASSLTRARFAWVTV